MEKQIVHNVRGEIRVIPFLKCNWSSMHFTLHYKVHELVRRRRGDVGARSEAALVITQIGVPLRVP